MDKKGPMLSNRALRRAKRMKQSEVLMYIDPFFRSNYVLPLQKRDSVVKEKSSIVRVKRGNQISSNEKCLIIANIRSTFHLENS